MKKISNLNKALNQFRKSYTILREDYGIDPENGYGDERMGMPDEDGRDIAHYRGGEDRAEKGPEEDRSDMNLSKSDERIAQIREIALNGLQDYAQDVDCEAYQFYKKIWLMCDKAVSEKDNAGNGGGIS